MNRVYNKVGEKYLTNEGYWVTIIESKGCRNCKIQFESGFTLDNRQFGDIKRGNIYNPYHLSVYGTGYVGIGKYKTPFKGRDYKVYKTWNHMIERGYSDKFKTSNPAYINCSVDSKWHCFQNFARWMENSYNSETMQGWQLDKDILAKGNKIYSPQTCCFVPQEINNLFTSCTKVRGKYPIGVTKKRNLYEARVSKNGERISQGFFSTPEEAFQAYKIAKEDYIKEVADKWKPYITPQTHQAMYNYQVEITD